MVVGGNTFINYMLELNNFDNVFTHYNNRYPEIELSDQNLQNIDYIFLSSEPYPFKEKHVTEISYILPHLKVILVNGEMFSWYGTRLIKSFDYFKNMLNQL